MRRPPCRGGGYDGPAPELPRPAAATSQPRAAQPAQGSRPASWTDSPLEQIRRGQFDRGARLGRKYRANHAGSADDVRRRIAAQIFRTLLRHRVNIPLEVAQSADSPPDSDLLAEPHS